jgi:MFS family permease
MQTTVRVPPSPDAPSARAALRLPSSLAALRHPLFRTLWIAAFFSNLGGWIEDVGEAWLMVTLGGSPLMVALVVVTGILPCVVLTLPAGALADQVDRRRFLLVTQTWMAAVAITLAVVTTCHAMSPLRLLGFTTALGIGFAVNGPPWQSLVPELVPRADLAQAVALNALNFNLARAIGPAIGGILVASLGPSATFFLNAASFLGVIVVLWRTRTPIVVRKRQPVGRAVLDGLSFAAKSVELKSIYAGVALFAFASATVPSLLASFASDRLHAGGVGYGLLLGSIGVGAIGGAVLLPPLRSLLPPRRLLPLSMATYAVSALACSTTRTTAVAMLILVPAGAAWLTTVSTFNALTQVHAPDHVRARSLAMYTLSFLGAFSFGSIAGGALANLIGVVAVYRVAALATLCASLIVRLLPVPLLELPKTNATSVPGS